MIGMNPGCFKNLEAAIQTGNNRPGI